MTPLTDFRAWLSPRHLRFWGLVLLILYTVAGFFLVPWVIQRELPGFADSMVQRPASVAAVRFNPWTLALEADGLELNDTDGSPLIGLAGLRINLQVASVFRRALVFKEVRLDSPSINLVRDGFADTNLGRLAAAASGPETETVEPEDDSALLRLVIESLVIDAGTLEVTDQMPATPFNTRLSPINISVNGLSTLPNKMGDETIRIATEGDGSIEWIGNTQISPLKSAGNIMIKVPGLPLVTRYLDDVLNFDLDGGQLDLSFNYDLASLPDGLIELAVDNLALNISQTDLATEDNAEPFLGFGNLKLTGGRLRLPAGEAGADELVITQPMLATWLREDGTLNLANLLEQSTDALEADEAAQPTAPVDKAAAAAEVSAEPADEGAGFKLALGRLQVAGMSASFEDRTLPNPGAVKVSNLDLEVRDISNTPDDRFPFELGVSIASGGDLQATGELGVLPAVVAKAGLKVEKLALGVAQPWIDQVARIALTSGELNAQTELSSSPEETLDVRGLVSVDGFAMSDLAGQELVTWQQLAMKDLIFSLDANQLEIARIDLRKPYARVRIDEERNLNLAQLVIEPDGSTDAVPEETASGEALVFRLGRSYIENGRVDFADLSLPLPFSTTVQEFGGNISTLASDTRQASELDFAGRVGKFGEAKVTGQLIALDPLAKSNVRVQFRNVNMPDLSPYTVDFAGRKIAAGKLNLDLDYRLEKAQLVGKNNIMIEKIKLGEKVDNPDALDLPLGLAVALLSDSNGVIDIDLDIEGDVNDPSFSAGGVIAKALGNLLTKIVTSPFRLLGSLIGGGDDVDLQTVSFEPGEATLSPPAEEKLTQLGTALAQRPALQLGVHGAYSAVADRQGIAQARVKAEADARVEALDDDDELLAERAREVLEDLARERLPELDLAEVRAQFTVEDDDPATPEFDAIAYLTELQEQLVAAEPVSPEELQALGAARARAVADYLAAKVALPPERVQVTDTREVEPGDENEVAIQLELDAG